MNLSELWNTPGFFYALGYSMTTAVILALEREAADRRRKWISCIAAWLFLSLLMHFTGGSKGVVYVASMLSVVGAEFVCFRSNLHDTVRALFMTVKTFILGEFSASLCWQIYYALALKWQALQSIGGLNAVMFCTYIVIMAVIIMAESMLRPHSQDVVYTWREVGVVLLIGLTVYVVSNLGYLDRNSLFSGTQARDIFAIRTLVDMNGVFMIFLIQHQLIEVQTRLEKDRLRDIMRMQYQAYQLSQESIDMVNQKYHDLKHQIALLREQAPSPNAEARLDQMEKDIRKYQALHNTGNLVLDAVLTNKDHICQAKGIELRYIADGKPLQMLDDMEVAALFGNMLDNAIEGVERIPDPARRLIRLYVTGEKGFVRIRIENTCLERLRFANGLPVTNKRDRRYHGFGMKSMQRTVEKYGGSLVAEQQGEWFNLKILIPMALQP